jgi:hypothetical protein
MSDSSLMEKHRLSAKGLQSMFNKLITVGIITQADLDARYSDADHTVDLKEQMPTLTQVLAHWELKGQRPGPKKSHRWKPLREMLIRCFHQNWDN